MYLPYDTSRVRFARRFAHSPLPDRVPLYQRRPGTLALRVDGFWFDTAKDDEGYPITGEDGTPKQICAAVWGMSLASGQKIMARLSTDEEEREDSGRAVSPARKELEDLRNELSGICPDGRPELLDEEMRPVWRLDRARPLLDEYGAQRLSRRPGSEEPYAQLCCAWVTPYNPRPDKDGAIIQPVRDIECSRPVTVNVSLQRSDCAEAPDYFRVFAKTVREAADEGEDNFFKACSRAAGRVVDTWNAARDIHALARFGSLSVTTWHAEEHHAFDLRDSFGDGRDFLENFLADARFAKSHASAVSPECIIRFLNDDDGICAAWRVRPWEFGGKQAVTPAQRAGHILDTYIFGLDQDFARERGITRVDVLPGRCHAVSLSLVQPERDRHERAAVAQVRNMLYLAFSQGRSPLASRRSNIGCSQAMVTRSPSGWVTGFFQLRDGRLERNAALLLPEGRRLVPADAYKAELEAEEHALTHLTESLVRNDETRSVVRDENATRHATSCADSPAQEAAAVRAPGL